MLNRISISSKVVSAFALVLAITIGLGLLSLNRLSVVNAKSADVRDSWLPSVAALGDLLGQLQRTRLYEARVVIAGSGPAFQTDLATLREQVAVMDKATKGYEPLIARGTDDEKLFAEFEDLWDKHKQEVDAAISGGAAAFGKLFDEAGKARSHALYDAAKADLDFNAASGKAAGNEAEAIYDSTRVTIMGALAFSVLLCAGLAFIVVTNVARPLVRMASTMRRIADHDVAAEIEGGERKDEIGAMATALGVFKESIIQSDKLLAEQTADRTAAERKAARLSSLMQTFEAEAGVLVSQISSASTELEATSQSMATNASQTDTQAGSAGRAADEASAGVQTVASAAEELTASIGEITRQVAQSAKVSQAAVNDVRRTDRSSS
jgi:methyl-accepting chemotaxis protein